MNCQEALNLLYDIIDKQASEIDTRQVKEHLEKCKHCAGVYKVESAVQDFISEKMSHRDATPKLESLKTKILDTLDTIDTEAGRPAKRRRPPFSSLTLTLAAAAFIVITIGAGLLLAGFYKHNQLFVPLEQAHWYAGKEMAEFQNSDETSKTLAHLASDLNYEPMSSVTGFTLVGGHTEKILGVEMTHLLYTAGDKNISVFVAPADRYQIPDDLKKEEVDRNNIRFFDHNCRGCRLVYHRIGNAIVITATTDRTVELLDFVPDHVADASSPTT
ncbi:MAG TPA: zf-HC2 domain-containing protein [Candidatus Acidoferrum sp.]|nr:zf-HC2 domain-containing protein [Candidatus Acidoferrum sp.]